jgi:hypothetical protein
MKVKAKLMKKVEYEPHEKPEAVDAIEDDEDAEEG